MAIKVTQREFLSRMEAVFGDTYDFSKSVYVRALAKVEVVCPTHGSFFTKPNDLYRGVACPKCAVDRNATKQRMTVSQAIGKLAEIHGDSISFPNILDEFKGSHSKLTVVCPEHGVTHKVSMQDLQKGAGCPKCGYRLRNKNNRLTEEKFKAEVIKKNGDRYDYAKLKFTDLNSCVTVTCKNHGDFSIKARSLYLGYGCKSCAKDVSRSKRAFSYDHVKSLVERSEGLTLISVDRGNGSNRARVRCDTHGEYETSLASLLAGSGCRKCSAKKRGEAQLIDFADFVDRANRIHNNRYTYNEDGYRGFSGLININCSLHGVFTQKGGDHISSAAGCPKCGTNKDSKPQVEISEFIGTLNLEAVRNYKFGDTRHEIDVFIPSLNIGVEYNGCYFHSQGFQPNSSYHKEKQDKASEAGIRLVQLFSDEWEFNRKVCERFIMNLVGANKLNKVYARETAFVKVGHTEASTFYGEHHIQGYGGYGVHRGLKYQNELVALMTFSRKGSGRRAFAEGEWELARFATSRSVVGGASKLFNACVKETNASNVVSFSDNRLFTGGVYKHLGFTPVAKGSPDYKYVSKDGNLRLHKSRFQHKHLKSLFGSAYDPQKSERENCEANGYYRIYDCGLTKWEWKAEEKAQDKAEEKAQDKAEEKAQEKT